MQKISMLGSGFIGRFYTDSLHGYRNKDRVISIYSRREESAKKFADDYNVPHWTTDMEESISHKDVDVVCISLPNNLHEKAVHLCCKHNKAVSAQNLLEEQPRKLSVWLKLWKKLEFLQDT